LAVARASATSRTAPRGELVEPLRSRVDTITGAAVGVDRTPIGAFSPFTPDYPYPASCFWYPEVSLIARVDVQVGDFLDVGQQRGRPRQVHQEPGGDRVELAHAGERERPQERPRRRHPPTRFGQMSATAPTGS
jgi:hypothetical protein